MLLKMGLSKSHAKKIAFLVAVLAFLAIPVMASVFVYLPINMRLTQISPPITFALGTNANQADLEGNTIGVSLGTNSSSATLSLHPTYQTTYYEDILKINDAGTKNYNVTLRVVTPVSLPSGGWAKLIVKTGTTTYSIDLTTSGDTSLGTIASGSSWQVDVEIYIPEGNALVTTSASLQLIYTPESGTPPTI